MSSVNKGNKLEDEFYQYLLEQKNRGELVYGVYQADYCEVFKKKSYPCKKREDDVQFDVVIEIYRKGRSEPHSYVVFECKNHSGSIPEIYVNDFSAKLERIFQHNAKGIMVVSSRLQSGAAKVAQNSGMGIVKYDGTGFETIVDRRGGCCVESPFIESQIFENTSSAKSLKFSAYYDGHFYGSIGQLLIGLDPRLSAGSQTRNESAFVSVPYFSVEHIKDAALEVLEKIDYRDGPVDLLQICSVLSIDLQFSQQSIQDPNGVPILGSANFSRNSIQISLTENKNRERFTISHEVGHFCLNHKSYLLSESVIERDLLIETENSPTLNYERLEFQANTFASNLILPDVHFKFKTAVYREILDIRDRGHGYIFVDDQPCNYTAYNQLLSYLSNTFQASRQAVEIKFKNLGMLTDRRKREEGAQILKAFQNITPTESQEQRWQ